MKRFIPQRVFFEPDALKYPLGIKLQEKFTEMSIPIEFTTSHNRVTGIKGNTPREKYIQAKQSLVVGIRRTLKFAACKPSAHYQLPLATSCPGLCEYCYLQTTLGPKPIVRVYVNLDEILNQTLKYIQERAPDITKFEGSATSDPVAVEYLTGSLKKTIEFFAQQELGRFRFVTKFSDVDALLNVNHNEHTEIRFSLNTDTIINQYEKATASMKARLAAAGKIAKNGYPLGFLIAPIIIYDGWEKDYEKLITQLAAVLPKNINPSFELITHRFTARAKSNIQNIHPDSTLPMNEKERQFKYGQFGYGKYVYPKDSMAKIKSFFYQRLKVHFPESKIAYLV